MKKSFLALVVLAGAIDLIASLATGCAPLGGCESASTGVRAAVEFTPSSVEATRSPSACGVTEPSFSSKDQFTLEAVGSTDTAPYGTLTLDIAAGVTIGDAIPLTVGLDAAPADPSQAASAGPATAVSPDGAVRFSLSIGADTSELDTSGLASVVVTVDEMPRADGQPLSAEVQIQFVDGRELDQTLTANVRSAVVLCAVSTSEG